MLEKKLRDVTVVGAAEKPGSVMLKTISKQSTAK